MFPDEHHDEYDVWNIMVKLRRSTLATLLNRMMCTSQYDNDIEYGNENDVGFKEQHGVYETEDEAPRQIYVEKRLQLPRPSMW